MPAHCIHCCLPKTHTAHPISHTHMMHTICRISYVVPHTSTQFYYQPWLYTKLIDDFADATDDESDDEQEEDIGSDEHEKANYLGLSWMGHEGSCTSYISDGAGTRN